MIDRERVEKVIGLLKDSSAMELAIREDGVYVRARRAPVAVAAAPVPAEAVADAPAMDSGDASAVIPPTPRDDETIVQARLVGRFYSGKGPGQPPIVNIGDAADEGVPLATIEALGKMTVVTAPETGEVIEIIAEDGQAVHFGTPLIKLRRKRR